MSLPAPMSVRTAVPQGQAPMVIQQPGLQSQTFRAVPHTGMLRQNTAPVSYSSPPSTFPGALPTGGQHVRTVKVPVTSLVQPAGTGVAAQTAANRLSLPKSASSLPGSTDIDRSTISVSTQPEKQVLATAFPEMEKDELHEYTTGKDDTANLVPDGFSDAETMEQPSESVAKDMEEFGEDSPHTQQLSPVMDDDITLSQRSGMSLSSQTSVPKLPMEAVVRQSTPGAPPLPKADSEDLSIEEQLGEFNPQQQEAMDQDPDDVKDADCFAFLKKPCGICVGSSARKLNSGN